MFTKENLIAALATSKGTNLVLVPKGTIIDKEIRPIMGFIEELKNNDLYKVEKYIWTKEPGNSKIMQSVGNYHCIEVVI